MLDAQTYLLIHLFGIFMTIAALGGMCLHVISGGTKSDAARKFAMMTHGMGLLIALVGGFGRLAKIGLAADMPGWVIAKLVIWLILGALPAILYRKPQLAKLFWLSVFVFAGFAAWLALYKPF